MGFLGLSLAAIFFLTLTPVSEWQWESEKRFSLCILCTAGAVPDLLENILLFLPWGCLGVSMPPVMALRPVRWTAFAGD